MAHMVGELFRSYSVRLDRKRVVRAISQKEETAERKGKMSKMKGMIRRDIARGGL